ncbi:MAG: GntR family transcriptional regulator, partial [Spirochaetota bacterium]
MQLFEKLRKDIIDGKIRGGDKLPSEHTLMRDYQVSSTTVRKSIDLLRNRGLIKRVQGLGTFVSDRPVARSLEKVLGFSKNMQQIGLNPSARVLEHTLVRAHAAVCAALNLRKNEQVVRLRRLRFGDRTPMLLETRYINRSLCPDIHRHDLTQSLYDIYSHYYGIS